MLGTGRIIFSIPIPVVIFVALTLLGAFLMRYTVFGRSLYARGSSPSAARLVGIRGRRLVFITFLLSGLATGVTGLVLVSQLGAASPNAATGLELAVVTAIILGGVSLSGGRGTITGTVLGILIIGVLNNGLVLLNVASFWQTVARGALLIAAASVDQVRTRVLSR
jgi:ribose transport system permease protein